MKRANELPAYRGASSFRRPPGLEEAWVDVPALIEEYQRAEEDRRAELSAAGSLAIELVEDGGDEPKQRHEPIPHREQTELFLPGTKPTPRQGFFEKLRFW